MSNSIDDSNQHSAETEVAKIPGAVRVARWLFIVLGLIWLVFGTWSVLSIGETGGNISSSMLLVIAILMFINSVVLLLVGWGIGRGQRLYYYFGLLVLAGNIFLTLTDEFGVFDLIVLVIAIALFILLLVTRSNYLKT